MNQHPPASTYPVAGLERRLHAFAADRLLVWGLVALSAALTWQLADSPAVALGVAAGTAVTCWLVLAVVLGVTGTSPGKSLTGLRVVHHGSGTPIGTGPALLRGLVLAGAGLPTFGIGVATLAWTAVEDRGRQRRGWHDHLAHSVVVDVRPAPVVEVAARDETPRHVVNLTALRLVPAPQVEAPAVPPRLPATEPPVRPQPAAPPVPPLPPSDDPGRTVARDRAAPAVPAAPARWRVSFDDGKTFVVEGLVLVGRRPQPRPGEPVRHLVPLTSADMSVSKTHAQLGPAADGTLVVMDRGSTNGTVLRRSGVARALAPGRPATLLAGDTVVFGDREMTLVREG